MTHGRHSAATGTSVNELLAGYSFDAFEVRNFQSADGLDRHDQRFVGLTMLAYCLSRGAQNPEDLRPIKPLTFTMIAEAH
jgi:hypothetical protein